MQHNFPTLRSLLQRMPAPVPMPTRSPQVVVVAVLLVVVVKLQLRRRLVRCLLPHLLRQQHQ